ncbi:MAG: GTPase domain-containing protein [Myxococcota bacterium]|nr:GTPase domain-containing protein [Myxococcota bacterium]
MATTNRERGEVHARIVYWGIEGSGKSTNLRTIYAKLRPDHRGELEAVPTRLDPTVSTLRLPIQLGQIGGLRVCLQIATVPGAPEHAPARKQLLDQVDGVVFVVDARRDRIDENLAAFEELRTALGAYGRSLDETPLVIQYNKHDESDPFVLEELHRKLAVRDAAAFEATAKDGGGVLQTLTTISKRVVRTLRESPAPASRPGTSASHAALAPEPAPAPPAAAESAAQAGGPLPRPGSELERAALAAAEAAIGGPADPSDAVARRAADLLDASWPEPDPGETPATLGAPPADLDPAHPEPTAAGARGLRIQSADPPELDPEGRLVVPVVLADEGGRELRLRLTISLDTLPD